MTATDLVARRALLCPTPEAEVEIAAPCLVGPQHAPSRCMAQQECEWKHGESSLMTRCGGLSINDANKFTLEALDDRKLIGRHVALDLIGLLMEGIPPRI